MYVSRAEFESRHARRLEDARVTAERHDRIKHGEMEEWKRQMQQQIEERCNDRWKGQMEEAQAKVRDAERGTGTMEWMAQHERSWEQHATVHSACDECWNGTAFFYSCCISMPHAHAVLLFVCCLLLALHVA